MKNNRILQQVGATKYITEDNSNSPKLNNLSIIYDEENIN